MAVAAVLALSIRLATAATNGSVVEIRDTLHGHFVYRKNCAVCHGRRGDGKGEMGVTVKPLPRDFGSGLFKYRSTPPGALPTDADLARTIRQGIPDTAMPIFSALPERDVRAVIDYLKTFSPRWREAKNYAPPLIIPDRPGWFSDMALVRRHANSARPFYAMACAPCHGEKGDGLGAVTNLVDSWGNPAPARDLRLPYLRSGKRPEDIYRVLITGIDGTPMPSFAEGTTEEQRWNLVAFIEQLRSAHPPRD